VIALPGSMRQDMVTPMGTMSMVVTPQAAFMTTPQGDQTMPASMKERVVKEIARTPLMLLRQRNAAGFKATATGAGKSGDSPVEQVLVDAGGDPVTLGIDPKTGRVLSVSYRGSGPTGAPADVVQTFSDFRDVNGVTLPFKMSSTFNGEPGASSAATSIRLNEPVDASVFAPPAKPKGAND
jgi:hypothetical protein